MQLKQFLSEAWLLEIHDLCISTSREGSLLGSLVRVINLPSRVDGGERKRVVLGQRRGRWWGNPRGDLQRLRVGVDSRGLRGGPHHPQVQVAGRAAESNLLARSRHIACSDRVSLRLQLFHINHFKSSSPYITPT